MLECSDLLALQRPPEQPRLANDFRGPLNKGQTLNMTAQLLCFALSIGSQPKVNLDMAAIASSPNPFQAASETAFPFDGFLGSGVDAHDPSIIEFKGTYVCFTTAGNGFCEMRTSSNLLDWKMQGPILSTPDWLLKAVDRHRSTWAPAPIRVGDSLRVYYCAS